ncbi:MAG: hypothetical protein R6U31_01000 [bacterium]
MKRINFVLLLTAVCLAIQGSIPDKSDIYIEGINEAVSIPSPEGFAHDVFHPGVIAGIEYPINSGRWLFFQKLDIGYYYHEYLHNAYLLSTQTGLRYTTPPGIFADVSGGIGYLHEFYTDALYEIDDNGEFTRIIDWGRPNLIILTGFTLGYDLSEKDIMPMRIYAGTSYFMEYPYMPEDGIPMLPHTSIRLGMSFRFNGGD